jgi:outer membrane protein OmpA-like peptidoglycan-associated protein
MATKLRAVVAVGVTALMAGLTVAAPATAAPAPEVQLQAATLISTRSGVASDVVTSDSTLSGLAITGTSLGPLGPSFDPATHDYQMVGDDTSPVTVTPTTAGPNATVAVTSAGSPDPLTAGSATVALVRGGNDVTITVTSADATTTTAYRVTIWRLAAPSSAIVSLADATSTVYGGTWMTVTLTDGQRPVGCHRYYEVGGHNAEIENSSFDPATGLTKESVDLPDANGDVAGHEDLTLVNYCSLPSSTFVEAVTTDAGAVTYTAGVSVTSVDVPATVTSGTPIVVNGPGISEYSDVAWWLTDAHGVAQPLDTWDYSGNNTTTTYPDYPDDADYGSESWFAGSGPRTLHVGYCPAGVNYGRVDDNTCTSVFSRTINWVAPTPADLSYSPSSGSVTGGTVITLRGRFILSGSQTTVIKVGDQTVPSWTVVNQADADDEDFESYIQSQDVIQFPAPPGAATGSVPITVTNDLGTTVAPGTFTYSAQPTITAIAPATVANSGGSVITVTGTAFGATGRPTVIIDGVKSPDVTPISATTLTAVVPPSADLGPVAVAVSSSQGGGISAAAFLDLVTPTRLPTVSHLSPPAAHVGDSVTVTGTGFGPAGTAGVSVGGQQALVTASSPTSITFEVPATGTTGAAAVEVGATTGAVTRSGALTILPAAGITAVTPSTLPSYATASADRVTLTGSGFGTTGTVRVGTAAAVIYHSAASGTMITGVAVPTGAAGSLAIVVIPTGATTALRATVSVSGPVLTYAGPAPFSAPYGPPDVNSGDTGVILDVPTTGGTPMLVQGLGFGPGGTVTVGATTVATTSWSDTAVTFTAPAHAAGSLAVTVTPTHSTLSASQNPGVQYVAPAVGPPTIGQIASTVDLGHPDRSDFDPPTDASNAFTLTGTNLTGTSAAATRVLVIDGNTTFTVVPTAVNPTSLTFAAPRGFTAGGWKTVEVDTNVGSVVTLYGLYYLDAGVQVNVSPNYGLCLRTTTPATGSVSYTPAVTTITNTGELFGANGTVTVDGVAITPTSYATGQVVIDMTNLATDLAQPWGTKTIVVTPADTSLPAQSVEFTCGVTPSVTTTAAGSTNRLTVGAGTNFTLGYTTTGFVGSPGFSAAAPADYEYVTAADYTATGFTTNVVAGAPVGAGDYYVRVALSRATYARADYLPFPDAPVEVVITGTPLTITPVSEDGASFTYKGQLGDGTAGSPADLSYTATSHADPITAVAWQYRDSTCTVGNPSAPWTAGLPKDVSIQSTACGGDGVTPSSWDVRVASFTMDTTGTDRSIYYQPTFPQVQITITPRNLTVTAVRADKVYDGTTTATLGALAFTGAVAGDDVSLAPTGSTATFGDATPGVNKPVTLGAPLTLTGATSVDYTLLNPSPTIVGTITRASAVLSLAASTSAMLLSPSPTTVTVTSTVSDSRTNQPVAAGADVAPVVLSSETPTICTVDSATGTVTPVAAGACVIAATEAASTNYQAAVAASDPTSTTETIDLQVFPAQQAISVVADDLTVAVGDQINPTSEASGLFAGDTIDGITYSYYSGTTLLGGAPTDPGTYTVVPAGGTLTAANAAVYTNPTAFTYVSGTLVITALPPAITTIAPASGPTTGGTSVTVTGTLLDTVQSVVIGGVTFRAGQFTVNQDGTALTFTTPAVTGPGPVDLVLVDGNATASYLYDYVTPAASAPRFTADSPPGATAGTPYVYRFTASGFPAPRFSVTGDLPAGLTLDLRTGVLSGVPTASGTFELTATNTSGHVTTTITIAVGSAITVPSVPRHLRSRAGDGKATLTFDTPATDGGAAIDRYQVSVDGGRWRTVTIAARHPLTVRVGGLTDGRTYRLRVRAENRAGPGAPSLVTVTPKTWVTDPVPPRARAAEIAIPADPADHTGPVVHTTATDRSHNGTFAVPIPSIHGRPLRAHEAAVLSGDGLFDFNSAVLTPAGLRQVRLVVASLKGSTAITCEGYTDYAGAAPHELALSFSRAVAVCQKLIADGAHVRTRTVGYGGSHPVIVGGTVAQRAANRRVVIYVNS